MNALNTIQHDWESDSATRPLGVSLLGIDRGLENTLRFFFSARCRNHFYVEPEGAHADIVIIDLDSQKGKKIWAAHVERNSNRPAILLSMTETEIDGAQVIAKPLRVSTLQNALDHGREQLQQQSKVLRLPTAKSPEQRKSSAQPEAVVEAPRPDPQAQEKEEAPAQNLLSFGKPQKKALSQSSGKGLSEKASHFFIGSAPDIDPADPQQLRKAQYDPRNFFVGRVLRAFHLAKEKNRSISLKYDRGSFTFFPEDKKVLVWMQERQLRTLAALPVDDGKLTISELDVGPGSDLDQNDPQHDLDALVWRLALVACRGRFPADTDPHAPVTLKHWPNLTRLQSFPHALRIAALWSQESHSLLDTAKLLDIPQRYVFSFYSAANLIGLASAAPRASEPAPAQQPSVRKREKRNILGRIVRHLRLFG